MTGWSERLAGAAILAGLVWRLGAAWPAGDPAAPYASPQEEYFLSSVILLSEGTFSADPSLAPQVRRGPLYPSFLALTQAGAPRPSPRRARLAQALLGALAALAAWGLAARLRSAEAGALAAAFVALDPTLVAATRGLDVHGFYGIVILLLASAAAHWAEKDGDDRSGALLGATLGASLLTRSAHLVFVPLLAIAAWAWWGKKAARRIGIVLLAAAALVAPWTGRNFLHTGRFVPLDAASGAFNLLAAADGRDGAIKIPEALAIAEGYEPGFGALHGEELEVKRDPALAALALRVILRDPGVYLRGCFRRLAAFWLPLGLFLLPALAAAFSRKAARGTQAAALVAASFLAYALIGLGNGYRLGVEPLLAALAGIGLAEAGRLRTKTEAAARWAAVPAAALVAAAAGLFLAFLPLDASASRRAVGRECAPAAPFLDAFLADGVEKAGESWYLARWAGTVRARPGACRALEAFKAGKTVEAAFLYDEAAALAPLDPEIRVSLAVALGKEGLKKRAAKECLRAGSLAAALEPTAEQRRLSESIRSTCENLER